MVCVSVSMSGVWWGVVCVVWCVSVCVSVSMSGVCVWCGGCVCGCVV